MGVLSVRGCEWVVCDHGRGVLPPLPANSAPPGCAEPGGSSSPPPPRRPSGEALHPAVAADIGVSHVPWCLCQALGRVGDTLAASPAAWELLGAWCWFLPSCFPGTGEGGGRILGLFLSLDLGERPGRVWRRAVGMLGVGERTGQSVPPVGEVVTPLKSPRLIL